MIVLGVALAVLALLVVVFVAVGGGDGDTVTIDAFGVEVTASAFVVFLAGAATLLVLLVGLWMIRWGAARYGRTRAEIQRLRRIEAEVEARQIAELSRGPSSGAVADERRHEDPVPTHHSPASPDRVPSREDGDPRDDRPGDRTPSLRPFEKDTPPSGASPSGATADDVPGETVRVGDGTDERDNSRL